MLSQLWHKLFKKDEQKENGSSVQTCQSRLSDGRSRPSSSKKKRLRREMHEAKRRKRVAEIKERWQKEREERQEQMSLVTTITEDLKAQGKWPPKWMQKPEKTAESIPCPYIYKFLYKQLNFNAVFSAKIVTYNSQYGIDFIVRYLHANMDFSSVVYYKIRQLTEEETIDCIEEGYIPPFQIKD